MAIKENIEKNPIIWLFSSLISGFVSGIAVYDKVIDISGQEFIAKSERNILEDRAKNLESIKKELIKFKAREGKAPDSHRLIVTSGLNQKKTPIDSLSEVNLDKKFILYSRWYGVSEVGFYEQHWKLLYNGEIVWENKFPFLTTNSGEWDSWQNLTLNRAELSPGIYRLKISLNNTQYTDMELRVK